MALSEQLLTWVPIVLVAYHSLPMLVLSFQYAPHVYITYKLLNDHPEVVKAAFGLVDRVRVFALSKARPS